MSQTRYMIKVNGRLYALVEKGLRFYDYDSCKRCALRRGCKKDNLVSKIYRMCYYFDGLGFRAVGKA